jgi:hypothetical protein
LIEDLKIILNDFKSWFVVHTKRESNTAANCLAKLALQNLVEVIWMEYPVFLHDTVLVECSRI